MYTLITGMPLFIKKLAQEHCDKNNVTICLFSKTCVKWPLSKRPKIDSQDQLLLNAGQKYCRMLQGEHSAMLLTFIKLQFVFKIFIFSIFEWSFYTGFTVYGIGSSVVECWTRDESSSLTGVTVLWSLSKTHLS